MDAVVSRRSDLVRVGLLMALALAARSWMLTHTEVASRDSIAFIRYALWLETPPDGTSRPDVVRTAEHPPGYPLAVLAASAPVRAVMGSDDPCTAMVRSCQVVGVLAGVLLVVPMYFAGRRLLDRGAAGLATAAFAVLPAAVEVTCDGLSDGPFLFVAATTLWVAVAAFQSGRPGPFLFVGLGSGAAYLVRPEGLILAAAAGATLLGRWAWGGAGWRRTVAAGLWLAVGAAALVGPYAGFIGKLTNKPTGDALTKMLEGKKAGDTYYSRPKPAGGAAVAADVPLGMWWNEVADGGPPRTGWAAGAFAGEFFKAGFYALPVLVLVGLPAYLRVPAGRPPGPTRSRWPGCTPPFCGSWCRTSATSRSGTCC